MLGSILWTVVVVLVVLWLLGFILHIGGGLIHLLLIVALIVLLYNLFVGRRARV
jgi:hypothetical protein